MNQTSASAKFQLRKTVVARFTKPVLTAGAAAVAMSTTIVTTVSSRVAEPAGAMLAHVG